MVLKMRKIMNRRRDCPQILDNGDRCRSFSMRDTDYCFTHNPDTKKLAKEASALGGKHKESYRKYVAKEDIINLYDTLDNHSNDIKFIRQQIAAIRQDIYDMKHPKPKPVEEYDDIPEREYAGWVDDV